MLFVLKTRLDDEATLRPTQSKYLESHKIQTKNSSHPMHIFRKIYLKS